MYMTMSAISSGCKHLNPPYKVLAISGSSGVEADANPVSDRPGLTHY